MDVIETQSRLIRLRAERFEATQLGVEEASPYISRLDLAISEASVAYVWRAVLEIAVLHGALTGAVRG